MRLRVRRIGALVSVLMTAVAFGGSHHNLALAEPTTASSLQAAFDASSDTYVQGGSANRNNGGAQLMQVRSNGNNRALVRFDQAAMQAAVGNATVLGATLELTITANGNNWGASGRTVDVHRLLVDWAEGNGTDSDRGSGLGATWNCAIDAQIENQAKNCTGGAEWEMGQPGNPAVHPWQQAPTATQMITNNQTGIVEYDVTADVVAFLQGTTPNHGWIVRKTDETQAGTVSFGTKEGGAVAELVVSYSPVAPPVTTRVFPTTTSQQSVVIVGAYGYVASYYDYEVVKVQLSDGTVVGRFPVGGSFPIAMTLHNGDLYVAIYGGSAVARMRTSDGAILATYATDAHPGTIGAFFGKLWVGNWDNGMLRAIDPVAGTTVCTYNGGGRHLSIAADEQHVYTTDPDLPGIRAIDPATCQEVTASNVTLSSYPGNGKQAIGFDGTYLWSVLGSEDIVVRIDRATHTVFDAVAIAGVPVGVAFDGLSAWIMQSEGHSITRLYTGDATVIQTIAVDGEPHVACTTSNQVLVAVWLSPNTLLIEIG